MTTTDLPPTPLEPVVATLGPEPLLRRHLPRQHAPRRPLDHYPRDPVRRWLLLAVFATPFWLLALLLAAAGGGFVTANEELAERATRIIGEGELIEHLYPPISTLAALVSGGNLLLLSLIGALAAARLLQKLLELLVQREVAASSRILILIALGASPAFAFIALTDLAQFLGIAFFGIGMAGMARFTNFGDTRSGFQAGLFFMLAVLSHETAVLYVAIAAAVSPLYRLKRLGQPGVRRANLLVLVFPSLSVLLSWLLLQWVFFGVDITAPFLDLAEGLPERAGRLAAYFGILPGQLLVASLLCGLLLGAITRNVKVALAGVLAVGGVLLGTVLGLIEQGVHSSSHVLLVLLLIATFPSGRRSPGVTAQLWVLALLMLSVAWVAALGSPLYAAWAAAPLELTRSLLGLG